MKIIAATFAKDGGKPYHFKTAIDVEPGDTVIARTSRGDRKVYVTEVDTETDFDHDKLAEVVERVEAEDA